MVKTRTFSEQENQRRVRLRAAFLAAIKQKIKNPALAAAKDAVFKHYSEISSDKKWDMVEAYTSGKKTWILAFAKQLNTGEAVQIPGVFKKGDFVKIKKLDEALEKKLSESDLMALSEWSRESTFRVVDKHGDSYTLAMADMIVRCAVHADFIELAEGGASSA